MVTKKRISDGGFDIMGVVMANQEQRIEKSISRA